jgi:eukaryotic-like serine/threonine-protein kinase
VRYHSVVGRGPIESARCVLYDEIASGGMATVYLGRAGGAGNTPRPVAVKRLHPHLARDPKFVAMFLDEARVASLVEHPNVVRVSDVEVHDGELLLVMEYVNGASLSVLLRAALEHQKLPSVGVVSAILAGALRGLHAAHEVTDEGGTSMRIVHRDVSPQNILVGGDGVARVVDFGIAKAVSRLDTTRDGTVKGKLAYMAPEQLRRQRVDRRTDVYAAGVVLWEALACDRLFQADDAPSVIVAVLEGHVPLPSSRRKEVSPELDRVVLRAVAGKPAERFASALEMADALVSAAPPATPPEVAAWVSSLIGEHLKERERRIAEIDGGGPRAHDAASPSPGRAYVLASREPRARLIDSETDVGVSLGGDDYDEAWAAARSERRPVNATIGSGLDAEGLEETRAIGAAKAPKRVHRRTISRWAVSGIFAIFLLASGGALATLGGRLIASTPQPRPAATAPASSGAREENPSASAAGGVAAVPTVEIAAASASSPSAAVPRPVKGPTVSARPRPALRPECDPPFTIDDKGIKRYNRACRAAP